MKPQTIEYLRDFSKKVAEKYPVERSEKEQAKDFSELIKGATGSLDKCNVSKIVTETVSISKSNDKKYLLIDLADEKVVTRFAVIQITDDVDSYPYMVWFGNGKRLTDTEDLDLTYPNFDTPVAITPEIFFPSVDEDFSFNFMQLVPKERLAILADVLADFQHVETVS